MLNLTADDCTYLPTAGASVLPGTYCSLVRSCSELESDDKFGLLIGRIIESEIYVENFCFIDPVLTTGDETHTVNLVVPNADKLIISSRPDLFPVGVFTSGSSFSPKLLACVEWYKSYNGIYARRSAYSKSLVLMFDTKFSETHSVNVRGVFVDDSVASMAGINGYTEVKVHIRHHSLNYALIVDQLRRETSADNRENVDRFKTFLETTKGTVKKAQTKDCELTYGEVDALVKLSSARFHDAANLEANRKAMEEKKATLLAFCGKIEDYIEEVITSSKTKLQSLEH